MEDTVSYVCSNAALRKRSSSSIRSAISTRSGISLATKLKLAFTKKPLPAEAEDPEEDTASLISTANSKLKTAFSKLSHKIKHRFSRNSKENASDEADISTTTQTANPKHDLKHEYSYQSNLSAVSDLALSRMDPVHISAATIVNQNPSSSMDAFSNKQEHQSSSDQILSSILDHHHHRHHHRYFHQSGGSLNSLPPDITSGSYTTLRGSIGIDVDGILKKLSLVNLNEHKTTDLHETPSSESKDNGTVVNQLSLISNVPNDWFSHVRDELKEFEDEAYRESVAASLQRQSAAATLQRAESEISSYRMPSQRNSIASRRNSKSGLKSYSLKLAESFQRTAQKSNGQKPTQSHQAYKVQSSPTLTTSTTSYNWWWLSGLSGDTILPDSLGFAEPNFHEQTDFNTETKRPGFKRLVLAPLKRMIGVYDGYQIPQRQVTNERSRGIKTSYRRFSRSESCSVTVERSGVRIFSVRKPRVRRATICMQNGPKLRESGDATLSNVHLSGIAGMESVRGTKKISRGNESHF